MRRHYPLFAALIVAQPVAAHAQNYAAAVQRVTTLVHATRSVAGAAPAFAVVMVSEDTPPTILVSGILDTRTNMQANEDTPFYIASMTKAYMGLLAVELDRRGVLSLDTSLAHHWPEVRIKGVDLRQARLRDLLAHRIPFSNDVLDFRTAYSDAVPLGEYAAILSTASTVKPAEFAYDNLGYVLYGATLERHTGRSWKQWLRELIFAPLDMKHTSARTSDFEGVTAAHQWDGEKWLATDPKPDALMHAAGGLVTSPRDMARWLRAHILGAGIAKMSFVRAHTATVYPIAQRGAQRCDGYAFGWNRCTAFGLSFLEHGGGYTGFRSQMMVAPDARIGIAILSNSDSMTGALSADLMAEFLRAYAGTDPSTETAEAFGTRYAESIAKQAVSRKRRLEREMADVSWRGWSWKPVPVELSRYVGAYRGVAGEARVRLINGGLSFNAGLYAMKLVPAAPGTFAGFAVASNRPEKVEFTEVDGTLRIRWQDREYTMR